MSDDTVKKELVEEGQGGQAEGDPTGSTGPCTPGGGQLLLGRKGKGGAATVAAHPASPENGGSPAC